MKERYLVEVSGDDAFPFHLSLVGPDGENRGSLGDHGTVEAAKAAAQAGATDGGEPTVLVWKDPPSAWQPDALCVSQYLEPMYPDLPG